MARHIHVDNRNQAWEQANKFFPTDYMKDEIGSINAGYPIYRSTSSSDNNWYNTICDLGNRLEVNIVKKNWKSETINIWIDFIERTSQGFRICGAED